ncbi:MAG TPA: NAD(P)H-binding protein [Solirubrobacteraceae bacterium]|nr:NAD(P)H-binding protein [Solirubrobacteraceae bacterium]
MRALVAGATGFIGQVLCERLVREGVQVRALVRDAGRTRGLPVDALELFEGDVLDAGSLAGAGEDVDVAYYLVHSMGRGGGEGDFEARELRAAEAFARMCLAEGVGRVVYLGGLGDEPGSKHLRSRGATAVALREHGPPLTYFRAGMVVGPGSESYRTLRHLVARLPFMIAPRWLSTPTQPVDVDDVVAYLAAAPQVPASAGREIQIGSPDVLPYGEMLDRMALALGRRPRPKLPVPFITPWLSSLWIGLVTPVDTQVARPLIEGLSTETVVTDRSGAALFDIEPIAFDASLRKAVAAERRDPAPDAPPPAPAAP